MWLLLSAGSTARFGKLLSCFKQFRKEHVHGTISRVYLVVKASPSVNAGISYHSHINESNLHQLTVYRWPVTVLVAISAQRVLLVRIVEISDTD